MGWDLIWIQTACHSDRFLKKGNFEKESVRLQKDAKLHSMRRVKRYSFFQKSKPNSPKGHEKFENDLAAQLRHDFCT